MTHFQRFVGIDVAKDKLDIHCLPDGLAFQVANTAGGFQELLAQLAADPTCAIACEASGGYEGALLVALADVGQPVWCLHPSDVRAFARIKGKRAKTDALDARAIAEVLAVAVTTRKPTRRTRQQSQLKDMLTARRALMASIITLKSLLAQLTDQTVRSLLEQNLGHNQQLLKQLAKAIQQTIHSNPDTAATERRIRSAPGAGPILAAELLTNMPELGSLTNRQAASLAGLAPHPRQSGTSNQNGHCQAGRGTVRRALYMATLAALRAKNPSLYPFYQRLRANGKPFKLAITAAMRKFIVILNTMIKNQADWHQPHPA
jgi:transposase